MWVMASSAGELLACQPYAGASIFIKAYEYGQGLGAGAVGAVRSPPWLQGMVFSKQNSLPVIKFA